MRVKPERVRVAVRKGTAPDVGSFVAFKAHLSPPLQPLRPGGYDFARDMYFQRIGASGFVLGAIQTLPPPHAPGLRLRYAAVLDGLREAINRRIHTILPGDRGSIASALITGKRNAISGAGAATRSMSPASPTCWRSPASTWRWWRASPSSSSALLLALSPSLASRRPIKKWAAVGALATGAFYLLLSGTGVSTQRAFIMIAIVLVGVMLDRPVLTFRTLAVAAFAVLLFAPQAVVHPSFQMSFAATLGADRRLSIRLALARRCRHLRRPRARRCGAGGRSAAWCWPRWSPVSPPRLTPPTTSIAWRPMACSPTCWPCRWSRPG